jgi:predicted nucleic acid-binding protein
MRVERVALDTNVLISIPILTPAAFLATVLRNIDPAD